MTSSQTTRLNSVLVTQTVKKVIDLITIRRRENVKHAVEGDDVEVTLVLSKTELRKLLSAQRVHEGVVRNIAEGLKETGACTVEIKDDYSLTIKTVAPSKVQNRYGSLDELAASVAHIQN